MAIGLYFGRTRPTDNLDPCYEAVRDFKQNFIAQFNALSCAELIGVHLGTPEGQTEFNEKGKISNCLNYAGEAARMVIEIVDGVRGNVGMVK